MPYGSTAKFEKLRSLAFGSVGANFTLIGSIFDFPVRVLFISNLTNQPVIFSDKSSNNGDGTSDGIILPANGHTVIDMMTNAPSTNAATFPKLLGMYAKHNGVAPTSGAVYVSGIYCKGD